MTLPDEIAAKLVSYIENACVHLDDYKDFIRDNHDADRKKKHQ